MQDGRADRGMLRTGTLDALLSLASAPFAAEPRITFVERALRIQAPVVCSPAGLRVFAPADRRDARVARVAVYADASMRVGERVELEVFLNGAEGERARMAAKVARVDTLGADGPARYDIVFDVTRIEERAADAVAALLT